MVRNLAHAATLSSTKTQLQSLCSAQILLRSDAVVPFLLLAVKTNSADVRYSCSLSVAISDASSQPRVATSTSSTLPFLLLQTAPMIRPWGTEEASPVQKAPECAPRLASGRSPPSWSPAPFSLHRRLFKYERTVWRWVIVCDRRLHGAISVRTMFGYQKLVYGLSFSARFDRVRVQILVVLGWFCWKRS